MSTKKKVIISLSITIVVLGIITAVLLVVKKNTKNKKEVAVYPIADVGYFENYNYDAMISGNVSVSMEQRVYLTSQQKIEEVYVSEGDVVKAGDLILTYDVTAQNLQLEIKRTEVDLAKVRITTLERELEELKKITPYEPPAEEPSTEEPPTEEPTTEEPSTEEPPTATSGDAKEEKPGDTLAKQSVPRNVVSAPNVPDLGDDFYEFDEPQYTKEELEAAIKEKEAEIRDARINAQLEEISYEIMKYQNASAELYCNFDGVVKTIEDPDTAIMDNTPYIVISSTDGYTVNSEIGELALMNVKVGDTVNMYCYDTGMDYTGVITEISDIPEENEYRYSASAQSFYPIKIAIPDANDLMQGMWVEINLATISSDESMEESSNDFYLPLAFVRKENGSYYIMKETDGKLEKVYIQTGKIQWGSEIEILGGITGNEYIAFPYSKDAVEGVKTKQSTVAELYGY